MDQLGTHGTSDWWDDTERTNYTNTLQCLIDQYGNYTSPSGTSLKAQITLNENVADNVGVRQAFRAYKQNIAKNGIEPKLPGLEEFTSEQLFFLGVANFFCSSTTPEYLDYQMQTDVHSPNHLRILGALSNNDDFTNHNPFQLPDWKPHEPKKQMCHFVKFVINM